jgi:hypothetical protein
MFLFLVAVTLAAATPHARQDRQGQTPARLEVIEDLSESLANDLHDLSLGIRDRDLEKIRGYLAAEVAGDPLPSKGGPLTPMLKWISSRTWTGGSAKGSAVSQAERVAEWARLLEHFSDVEDARVKVRGAFFDEDAQSVAGSEVPTARPGARGDAKIGFWIVGRNRDGHREWARGGFDARVDYPEGGPWRISGIRNPTLTSMTASVDMFSEVSGPAGLTERLPAFGTPGNSGFVWKGAAAGDLDGDGSIDLFVTAANRNILYLNDGAGRFREASKESGVGMLATGSGPLLLDYDNDGDMDVFITAVGPQVLLQNRLKEDGQLRFHDVSLETRVAVPAVGFSAAAADVNGDGRPDIYVTSYNHYGRVTPNSWSKATNGTPNLLFVSQPGGGFRQEAARWGVDDSRWSYAAAFADVNEDGRTDLYVANDFGENALFINHGDRFQDEARERGVIDPGNGMGVSFGDYNNDGRLDLHVTNMSSTAGNRILGRLFPEATAGSSVLVKLASGNNLYENIGNGHFKDVTKQVGGLSGMWAWGGGFIDVDNDGTEDIFTPNGFISGKSMKDT